jgi:hypothetical protein
LPERTDWAPIVAQWAFTAITSLASFFAGAAVAGAQQDRANLKRQSGIAAALLEDLNRIDEELGRIRDRGLKPWDGRKRIPTPTIHPWIESLIAQSAEEEPNVIAGFMRLQRALATMEEQAERAAAAFDDVHARHEVYFAREQNRLNKLREEGQQPVPLGDDRDGLIIVALMPLGTVGAATAQAKLDWQDALACEEKALSEYRYAPHTVMTIVFDLTTLLVPLAYRRIDSLPAFLSRTLTRVSEDVELEEMETERLLRVHGFGYLADRRRAREVI